MLVSKNSFLKRSSLHAVLWVRFNPQKRKEFASNSPLPNKPLGTVIPLCWAEAQAPAKARCFPEPLNLSQRCKDGHHSTWVVIQQWKHSQTEVGRLFSERPDIKYFRLWGPYSPCRNYSVLAAAQKKLADIHNRHVCVPVMILCTKSDIRQGIRI